MKNEVSSNDQAIPKEQSLIRLPTPLRFWTRRYIAGTLGLLLAGVTSNVMFQWSIDMYVQSVSPLFLNTASINPSLIFRGVILLFYSSMSTCFVLPLVCGTLRYQKSSVMLVILIVGLLSTAMYGIGHPLLGVTQVRAFDWNSSLQLITSQILSACMTGTVALFAMRVLCGTQLQCSSPVSASGDQTTVGRSSKHFALSEALAATLLIGLWFHIRRVFPFESPHWYGYVLAAIGVVRSVSLSPNARRRWIARFTGMLAFVTVGMVSIWLEESGIQTWSIGQWCMAFAAQVVTAIIYWFVTMIPILWLQINDWKWTR